MSPNTDFTIVIDTREQKPYNFYGVEVVHSALKTGDYSVEGFEHRIAVERKSLNDLANTLGRGRARFKREIDRAQEFDRFVVVIEADRHQVEAYRDEKSCPSYYSQIHPNAVLGTVDKWPGKYPVLDFVWAGDRAGGKALTLDLLKKWAGELSDGGLSDFL